MKKNIIFTSRDPGAANQLLPIIKKIQKDNFFNVYVVASDIALDIFTDAGIQCIPFNGKVEGKYDHFDYKIDKNDLYTQGLIDKALDIFRKLKPDILFTGLSSVGFGIDEIMLYISKNENISTYTFIDFWGGYNSIENTVAQNIFVLDDYAKQLSTKRSYKNIYIAGSPKHQRNDRIDFMKERQKNRNLFNAKEDTIVLTFFAQTLLIKSYYLNYLSVLNVLSSIRNLDIKFIIKSHPKEFHDIEKLTKCAERHNLQPIVIKDKIDNKKLLLSSDIIMTCTSSIGMDHAYLSSYSNVTIGCVLYLRIGDEIQNYMIENFGFDVHPLVKSGIGYIAKDESDIQYYIENIKLNNDIIDNYFMRSKKLQTKKAIERIVRIINVNELTNCLIS